MSPLKKAAGPGAGPSENGHAAGTGRGASRRSCQPGNRTSVCPHWILSMQCGKNQQLCQVSLLGDGEYFVRSNIGELYS